MSKINAFTKQKGWIEVICGPMFAGKSEELLRRINLLKYADVKYLLFKPTVDTRTNKSVQSRDGRNQNAITVDKARDIIEHINAKYDNYQVIAIDEVQFFDEEIAEVCAYLANNKYIVIAAGLDLDFAGDPFPGMTKLLAYAEEVTKLSAICTNCGAPANMTEKITKNKIAADYMSGKIEVGDNDMYAARCRHCHDVSNKPDYCNFPKIKKAKADF